MINIVCLKHGTLYDASYVNKLRNMVSRNLSLPHKVVCFTDDPSGIDSSIECRTLPDDTRFTGWWWKPYVFARNHFSHSDVNLFIDLDMVIVNDMRPLFEFPGDIVGMRDVIATFHPSIHKLGSAVMRWQGDYSCIWDELVKNPSIMRSMRGDQDWIWHRMKNEMKLYPLEWIPSYKWGIRNKTELVKRDGKFVFSHSKNVNLPSDAIILAFHGTPNPEDVNDQVILDHWR